jgi:hypothetical protein
VLVANSVDDGVAVAASGSGVSTGAALLHANIAKRRYPSNVDVAFILLHRQSCIFQIKLISLNIGLSKHREL